MTYVKGTFYAFITAILYALVSIFSKVLDERHRSIYFALLSAYVMLWIVFAPLQVIERHQEGGEEVGGEEKVNKIGKMTSDKVIRYDQSEGVEKKLRRHKMYDSYAFLPGLVGGNREHMESITTTSSSSPPPSSSSFAVVGVVADVEKGEKDPKKFSRLCCRPNEKTLALIMMVVFDFIGNYSAILCFKFTSNF